MIFYTRLFIAGFIIGITAPIYFLMFIVRPTHPNNTYYYATVFNFIGKYIYQLSYEIQDIENRELHKSCIFVSNHQGNMDIFVGSRCLKKGTVSLGKKSLLYIPVFGLLYYLSGNILITRNDKRKSQGALKVIRDTMKKYGTSLWIMPEGTRNEAKTLLPFKRGAFVTAIGLGVPIVPVAIKNYKETVNIKKFQKNIFRVKFLEPIPTEGLVKRDAIELADRVQGLIQKEI